jgi:hypothetical protein
MVPPVVCDNLRRALNSAAVPVTADGAEATLTGILATMVPKLVQARVGDDSVHPWCAMVAADLEPRMTWRTRQPPRG